MSVRLIFSALALCAFTGCHAPAKPDRPADQAAVNLPANASVTAPVNGAPPKVWADKMQGLSVTLSDLLPLVASRTRFNEPTNFSKIESSTRDLRTLSHDLKNTHAPNADPMMNIMSGMMSDDIDRALDSLRAGNRDYARQILKDTASYCFQCHTQTAAGPNGKNTAQRLNLNVNTKSLSPLDQAEFFAATRQFDQALASYRSILSDSALVKTDAFSWEQAARSALAIIVRVKNDPQEAALLIAKLEKQTDLPLPVKQSVASWKKTVRDWLLETPGKQPAGAKGKFAGKELEQASKLIETAQKRQEFPLDHSQDIAFFRAASLVHTFLQRQMQHEPAGARALYLAGVVAEATRDMSLWALHETYYEQCIRWSPHSMQAETCFDRLKDSVTLGYSGSSGINIPGEVAKRLETFRVLADADPKTDKAADPTGGHSEKN